MSVNEKMAAIADAIRGKTGGTEPLTLDQMATEIAGIQVGEGSGGVNMLDYACSLESAFVGCRLNNVDLVISFGSKCGSKMASEALYTTFNNTEGVKSITINWGGEATTTGISFFNLVRRNSISTDVLETIDLRGMQNCLYITSLNRCFENRNALREILGELDLTNCTTTGSIAARCYALETISFKAGTIMKSISFIDCSKLTDETIQNIIDGLADLSGGTAQTLTLHATVGAKLTDAQKAAASAKNWTISY